jgi:hypothetical protein
MEKFISLNLFGWFDSYYHARPPQKKGEVGYTLEVVDPEYWIFETGNTGNFAVKI